MKKDKKSIGELKIKDKNAKQQKLEDAQLSELIAGIKTMLNSDKK